MKNMKMIETRNWLREVASGTRRCVSKCAQDLVELVHHRVIDFVKRLFSFRFRGEHVLVDVGVHGKRLRG